MEETRRSRRSQESPKLTPRAAWGVLLVIAALVAVVAGRSVLGAGVTVAPASPPPALEAEESDGAGDGSADVLPTPADPQGHAESASAAVSPGPDTTTPPELLTVHVTGAVAAPGVYELPGNSRVDDALTLAGGLAADAQEDALNRAAPLSDGSQIRVPFEGEPLPPAEESGVAPPVGSGSPTETVLISLTSATSAELEELPGIGPALADAILQHREQHGPFTSVEQLDDVPGIGPGIMSRVRDLVVP